MGDFLVEIHGVAVDDLIHNLVGGDERLADGPPNVLLVDPHLEGAHHEHRIERQRNRFLKEAVFRCREEEWE